MRLEFRLPAGRKSPLLQALVAENQGPMSRRKRSDLTRNWSDRMPCRLPTSQSLEEGWRRDNSISGSKNIFFYPVANLQGRKLKQSCFPNLGQGYFPYLCRNILFMRRKTNQGQTESNSMAF